MRRTETKIRKWRVEQKLSLDAVCDLLKEQGLQRPSIAKVSRIEWGLQNVPLDMVPALSAITGFPAKEIRPDLAEKFKRMFAEVAR